MSMNGKSSLNQVCPDYQGYKWVGSLYRNSASLGLLIDVSTVPEFLIKEIPSAIKDVNASASLLQLLKT